MPDTAANTPPKFADDGLPETFTEDDLEELSEIERTALLKEQQEEAEAAAPTQPVQQQQPAVTQQADADPLAKITRPDTAALEAEAKKAQDDIKALRSRYQDAEIGDDEFEQQMDQLLDKVAETKAQIRAEETIYNRQVQEVQQTRAQAWYGKVDGYMTENPVLRDAKVLPIFDSALRQINSAPEFANWPDEKRIAHAHRLTLVHAEGIGIIDANTAQQQAPAKRQQPQGDTVPTRRTDERPMPPMNLGSVTGSELSGVDDGAFDVLDRVIDDDYERAEQLIGSLDHNNLERFLRGA